MKKHLLLCGAFSFVAILPVSAQLNASAPHSPGQPAVFESEFTGTHAPGLEEDGSRAVSCTDKVTYVDRYPASSASAFVGGNTGFDVVLQLFPEYEGGQVTKADFTAAAFTAGTKTVSVIVYANDGSYTILASGTANISGTTATNYSVTFTSPANIAAGADGFYIGVWAPSGDSIKVGANTDGDGMGYTFAQVGTTMYSFLSNFGYDIDLLIRPTIKFNHPLTASLNVTPASVCVGSSASFNGNYSGTPPLFYYSDMYSPDGLAYDLDFGDGSAHSTFTSSSHAYSTAGSKTASFKVIYQGWTSDCPSDPATQSVTVNPLPTAFFAWSATNLAVSFTNMSTAASTYSWAFGDAGTASAPSPVHNYAASGTYTVELTSTGTCGSDMYFTNITITDSTNGGSIGIVEAGNGLLTNIYPNPASDHITIDLSLSKHQDVNIEVFDALGQMICNKALGNIRSSVQQIDLSAYETGVYFVRIVHGNAVSSRMFVKQ